jgi:hypothetical protein
MAAEDAEYAACADDIDSRLKGGSLDPPVSEPPG